MKDIVRNLNSYSNFIPCDIKEANFMFWQVKGHLIPSEYSNEDVISMYDSYFKRLWGNNESRDNCRVDFEKAWEQEYVQK
tara:strand:- start:239 stop:478 length:240 start_codon:yes stop_codon:yes gene_type:complete